MLAAVALFAVMDASLKQLSASYPPLQVASMRAFASMPFLLGALVWTGSWRELRMRRPGLHLMRGLLGIAMLSTFVYAVSRMSIANTYALYLCGPLMVTGLSVPLLGARVSASRWAAIAIGLGGAMFVLQPNASGFELIAGFAAAVSAICYSLSAITISVLGRTDSNRSMVFSFMLAMALGAGLLAMPSWRPIEARHLAILALIGLVGALGQYFITEAFSRAPPFVVVPFEYTAILWAFSFDWLFWQILPTAAVLLGGAIVIGCGLYIIWDERRSDASASTDRD
jgi:drug/metabolite transporter (DMT)-like permease